MSAEFLVPERIITGENAVIAARDHIKSMGKKALIVTAEMIAGLECFRLLTDMLDKDNASYAVFDGVNAEPDDITVNRGLEIYKAENCDFLIGIGGGSALDTMKAIAVLAANGGEIADYMGKSIVGSMPKTVAIPTTAGTGSEATRFTVITDSKRDIKMLLGGSAIIPSLALADPYFTLTSPKSVTASTGLDALTHAIESYTSRKAQPLTDSVAISAAKRIFKYLPVAYRDGSNIKAREELSVAALEAGIAINNASVTIVHGMSRPIGALFHVPHGLSNAMLLEKCLSFALDGAYERFADIARAIGAASFTDPDEKSAKILIEKIRELCNICEVPTLEQYGVDREKFFASIDKMSGDALASGSPANTVKTVTKEDMIDIYKSLW